MAYVIVGIVLAVVLVAAVLGYLLPRRRGAPPAPPRPEGTRPSVPPRVVTGPPAPQPSPSEVVAQPAEVVAQPAEVVAQPAEVVAQPAVPQPPAELELEAPAPMAGRLVRLRARLARSQSTLGKGLLGLLARDRLDDEAWEEVEDALLQADVGVAATTEIVARLRARTRVLGTRSDADLRTLLTEELVAALDPAADRTLHTLPHPDGRPAVLLVVGVNGTGKTTTCGKLARVLVADGRSVLLGAADTFRAAAADQLTTWGARVGARTVRGPEGADPASVAFEAVKQGVQSQVDAVLVDTAGRLHTKTGLMDELGKVKRVVEKHGPVDETLLVLDATTGQNGVVQARVFTEAVDVTGIVLTKLDGTAKGGIVISVQRELGVPVKLVGLGEGPDDLAPFDPSAFVEALLAED